MPYKPLEIEHMLSTKLRMVISNADHKWFEVQFDNLPIIRTKLPNHRKDIWDKLESKIYRQLRVRKNFFHELMGCTKNRADYENQLRTDPYPSFDQIIV